MRFWAAVTVLLLAVATTAQAQPRRIVSVNLFADAYLMALADPGQVVALSPFSRDPSMSYYYKEAAAYPSVRTSAEAVLALKPDLVLTSPFLDLETRAMLRRFAIPMTDLGDVKNFSGIVAQTRAIAALVGHPERGEKLIAAMQAQLAAIASPRGQRPIAVHYQRQGYVTGTDTLMDDMMARHMDEMAAPAPMAAAEAPGAAPAGEAPPGGPPGSPAGQAAAAAPPMPAAAA